MIETRLSSQALGRRGESYVRFITEDVGVILSKSDPDLMGWDYFAELTYNDPDREFKSLDKRCHPLEAKLQVKTVYDGRSIGVKLSAAEQLARSSLPSFVVSPIYNSDNNPIRIIVFHVIDGIMGRILKRLRQASATNSLAINRQELVLNASSGVSLEPTGRALVDFMLECCGPDFQAYARKKANQITTLGYKERPYSGAFTTSLRTQTEVNEAFLGLREMPITKFEHQETRFGIAIPLPIYEAASIEIVPKPIDKCRITLNSMDGQVIARVEGDIYLPPTDFRNESFVFRVETDWHRFVFYNERADITAKQNAFATACFRLETLVAAARVCRILASGEGRLEIFAGGKPIWGGLYESGKSDREFQIAGAQEDLLQTLLHTAQKLELGMITANYQDTIQQSEQIAFLADVVSGAAKPEVKMQIQPVKGAEIPSLSVALFVASILLGSDILLQYSVADAEIVHLDQTYVLKLTNFSLRDVDLIPNKPGNFLAYVDRAKATTGLDTVVQLHPPEPVPDPCSVN